MPMRKEDYHPKWKLISRLIIRKRAGNRCEHCGVKNESIIRRHGEGAYEYASPPELDDFAQLRQAGVLYWNALKQLGLTRIILTTAHLDHDRKHNSFSNLKALCQRCHFQHDREANQIARKYGKYDNTLPIFTPQSNGSLL